MVGKSGSCAAVALAVADHLVPAAARMPVALAVLALVTLINCLGVQRTAAAARLALIPVVAVLLLAIGAGAVALSTASASIAASPLGVLQAAGLVFFAFAGYARVTTLAEEVRDPSRALPRAVLIAVAGALALYAAGAAVLLHALGAGVLAASDTPWLALAARTAPWLLVPLQVVAVLAAGGSLLALVAGVSRTALAMAREHDLPAALSRVHPRFGTPVRAEVAGAVVAGVILLAGDLRLVVGFSSFAVLLYYLVANASALRQPAARRLVPRAVPALGALGCCVLAVTLPWQSAATAALVILAGCAARLLRRAVAAPASR